MSDSVVPAPTYSRTPRVAFYTYPEWAFGSIHTALCKELYKHGIFANVIDWNWNFTSEERRSLSQIYDVFVTVPGNSVTLLRENFDVPEERIIAIAHGRYDIDHGLSQGNDFGRLKKFAGVSPDLACYAASRYISREMTVVRNGIHFDYFYQPISTGMSVVGYGGAYQHKDFSGRSDIKRGYLAEEMASIAKLPFRPAPRQSYLCMPSYYYEVDCVIVSSLEESCGLPLMEAAAAGRVPISTCVGVARDVENYPGIVLPSPDADFVVRGSQELRELVRNPVRHRQICKQVQDFSREYYDWSVVIDDWVKLLS